MAPSAERADDPRYDDQAQHREQYKTQRGAKLLNYILLFAVGQYIRCIAAKQDSDADEIKYFQRFSGSVRIVIARPPIEYTFKNKAAGKQQRRSSAEQQRSNAGILEFRMLIYGVHGCGKQDKNGAHCKYGGIHCAAAAFRMRAVRFGLKNRLLSSVHFRDYSFLFIMCVV